MLKYVLVFMFGLISCFGFAQTDSICQFIGKLRIDSVDEKNVELVQLLLKSKFKLSTEELDSLHKPLLKECESYRQIFIAGGTTNPPSGLSLSENSYYKSLIADKTNGTLVAWTKEQKKEQIQKCYKEIKAKNPDYKSICKCGIKAVSSNMNYSTFVNMSDYQQGKALSTLSYKECKRYYK